MAEGKPEQEPSIEEILASIRQIISDDDEQPQKAAATPAPAEPEPEPEDEEEDDVLELTEMMQEEPDLSDAAEENDSELDDELDIALAEINETLSAEATTADPVPDFSVEEEDDMPAEDDDFSNILSEQVKSATLASMSRLASGMPVSKPEATPRHYDGVTLEDIVRDLLNPMLRDWMTDNLPPLVERIVQKEMEKLARKALDS